MKPAIIYEDNHLLAVDKPAGLATMGVPAGVTSLLDVCRQYLRIKYRKPGNVYLGVVSRLDAPVTGIILLARTSKAAARLTNQFRLGEVEKRYWALVEGTPEPLNGRCVDWVRHDERHRRMHIAAKSNSEAKEARLSYHTIRPVGSSTLIEVELQTGRKHQIRLQLAHRKLPILGDRKYGARRPFPQGIALHARFLALAHPVGGARLEFTAPLPAAWPDVGMRGEG